MSKARDLANIISTGVPNSLIALDANEIPNIPASKITSGTFADARISNSSVSQFASSFDDNKIVNDISTLAIRQASNENKGAYNTNSMFVDVFQDGTGIASHTTSARNASEYVSSVVAGTTDTNVTINSSNYTQYFDTTDANFMSVSKHTSGLAESGSGSNADVSYSGNANFHSSSVYSANATIVNTHEPNLIGYIFGANSNSSQYVIQNTDTSASYRLIYFNLGFKSGITFKPNGSWGFRWLNGAGGFSNLLLFGLNTTTHSRQTLTGGEYGSGVSNGSSYNSNNITNSNFYSGISLRTYHTSNQAFTWDSLNFAGTARQDTLVTSATGNFISNAITAPSSTSKMGAIITYQDQTGTNALNTDIVLQLSADNGSNFTTATMTAMPDFASGIKMAKVNDLSVTAGTQLKYKISFANQASGSKEARIRGVSLQF